MAEEKKNPTRRTAGLKPAASRSAGKSLAQLVEEGKNPFEITKYDVTHHTTDIEEQYEALEGKEVSVAGRLMSKRVMGKASFCHIQDLKGMIQCYVARDDVGEDAYKDFKKYDIGDIVGVKGFVFTTKTGEKSIHAKETDTSVQEPADPSGEISRPDKYRSCVTVKDMWI